jgi:hypothetical protein
MSEQSIHEPRPGGRVMRQQTPQRQIRIPDDVYYAAVAKAKLEAVGIGALVTRLLREYVDGDA